MLSANKETIEIRELNAKNKASYPIKGIIIARVEKQTNSQTANVVIIIFFIIQAKNCAYYLCG